MKGSKYVWKGWKQFIENDVSISNSTISSGSHTKQFKSKEELKPLYVPIVWKGWTSFIGKRGR